MLVIFVKESP